MPDVPTVAEFYPGFSSVTWFAMAAPEGTPAAVAQKIARDIADVIKSPEVNQRLRAIEMTPRGDGPAETRKFLDEERARWTKLIAEVGVQPQ